MNGPGAYYWTVGAYSELSSDSVGQDESVEVMKVLLYKRVMEKKLVSLRAGH